MGFNYVMSRQHASFYKKKKALTEITSVPSQSHHEERAPLLPGPHQGGQNPEELHVSGYRSLSRGTGPPTTALVLIFLSISVFQEKIEKSDIR